MKKKDTVRVPSIGKLPATHKRKVTMPTEDITSRAEYQSPFKRPDVVMNYDDPRKTIAVDDDDEAIEKGLTDIKG